MNPIFVQAFAYGVWGALCILGVGVLLKGFFGKYLKVRTSFGKLLLVKIRTPLRDYFETGWIDDGFLVYKHDKVTYRLTIRQDDNLPKPFYRCLAVTWIDVDEQNHAVCLPNYSSVPGFDLQKHDSVVSRALMKPAIQSNTEKIIMICSILAVLGIVCLILLMVKLGGSMGTVLEQIASMKGIIIGGTTNI